MSSKLSVFVVLALCMANGGVFSQDIPYDQLKNLDGSGSGSPLMISNNPEAVHKPGMLAGTMATKETSGFQRKLSGNQFQDGCPAQTMKEFTFYMHHLNYLGTGAGIFLLLTPTTGDVTFDAEGSVLSQAETGTLDPQRSPSFRISSNFVQGKPNINIKGQAVKHYKTAAVMKKFWGAGHGSMDARIHVKIHGGCAVIRAVAVPPGQGTIEAALSWSQKAYAYGNIVCPCCTADYAWGTPAGVYKFDTYNAQVTADLTSTTSKVGFRWCSAVSNSRQGDKCIGKDPYKEDQSFPAIAYYISNNERGTVDNVPKAFKRKDGTLIPSDGRDSDPRSTANYGAEYKVAVTAVNKNSQCVIAKLRFASYAGRRPPSHYKSGGPTRFWDGEFAVAEGTGSPSFVKVWTKPGRMYQELGQKRLEGSSSVTWNIRTLIPGLISIPAALVVESHPCDTASASAGSAVRSPVHNILQPHPTA